MTSSRVLLLAVVALLASCKGTERRYSGFLDDYSKLEQSKKYENTMIWLEPGIDLRPYDRLMIDPVQVKLHPDSKAAELGEKTLGEVAAAFTRILVERIEPYYTVVREPGPDVLRVRIALTDVVPLPDETKDPDVAIAGAAMEGELLDASSGRKLAAFVDRIEGSAAGQNESRKWRQVEGAFVEWSNRLLDYVDSFHEDAPQTE